MADHAHTVKSARPTLPEQLSAVLVLVRHGESVWVAEGRFQGRRDPPLSDLGRRQAQLVARRLAEPTHGTPLPIPPGPPRDIWHSPLSRAAATAETIARAQPAPARLQPTDHLTELAQGEWEGLLHGEVSARWPAELARWRRRPAEAHAPGGESLLEAAGRVSHGLQAVIDALQPAAESVQPAADSMLPAAEADGMDHLAADAAGDLAALRRQPVPGYPSPTPPQHVADEPWSVLVAHDGIFRLVLMTLLDVPYERFWSFPFNLCAITVISISDGLASLRAHNLSEHLAPLTIEPVAAEEARGDRRGAL